MTAWRDKLAPRFDALASLDRGEEPSAARRVDTEESSGTGDSFGVEMKVEIGSVSDARDTMYAEVETVSHVVAEANASESDGLAACANARERLGVTASADSMERGADCSGVTSSINVDSFCDLLDKIRNDYVIVWMIDNDFRKGGENIWKAIEQTLKCEQASGDKAKRGE